MKAGASSSCQHRRINTVQVSLNSLLTKDEGVGDAGRWPKDNDERGDEVDNEAR